MKVLKLYNNNGGDAALLLLLSEIKIVIIFNYNHEVGLEAAIF